MMNQGRESRRNVETEAPVLRRNNDIVIETKPISTPTPSYDKYRSSAVIDTSSYDEPATETVRGSWRKDIAKFEENLTKKSETKPTVAAAAPAKSEPSYSWKQSIATTTVSSTAASTARTTTATSRAYTTTTSTAKAESSEEKTTSSWTGRFKKYADSESTTTTTTTSTTISKPVVEPPKPTVTAAKVEVK